MSKLPSRGMMLCLSSPSGAGKSTLARALLRSDTNFVPSISITTRARRPSEVDGVDYRFVDTLEFERLKAAGELLEWAEVHGNLYGTPYKPVLDAITSGRDVVFDIDWQGARDIKTAFPTDAVGVFVLPPSAEHLRSRLISRGEDSPETIVKRLQNAREEIEHWRDYDHVLINADVGRCSAELAIIIEGERLKRLQIISAQEFVPPLLEGIDCLVEEISIGLDIDGSSAPRP